MSGEIKAYVGGAFAWKPVKVWNGSAWAIKPLKYWNGSAWVLTNNAGASTLAAPVLGYPSPIASNPTTIPIALPGDWQTGDTLVLARSASAAMSSPTLLTHTLTDADTTAGTINMGLSAVTLSGITYFQAYGRQGGADSPNRSGIVAWGDTVAPTISTATTGSITETSQLAVTLAATDTGGVPALVSNGTTPGWYIAGGADQLQFQINVVGGAATLQWYGNGSQLYASPADVGTNNVYDVTIGAIDYSGNAATPISRAQTVTQIDQTPTAFAFTDVNGATLSTLYTSNTVTMAGLEPSFDIPATVSGGQYSKNGGAWTAAGSFTVQNGDTLAVRVTSPASNSATASVTVTVGTYTDIYTVATPGSSATLTIGTGGTGAGVNRSRYLNVASPGYQSIHNTNDGAYAKVRATLPAANTKWHAECRLDGNWPTQGATGFGICDIGTSGNANTDFNTGAGSNFALPGDTGFAGLTAKTAIGNNQVEWHANGSSGNFTVGVTLAAGDKIILEGDESTHVYKVYVWDASANSGAGGLVNSGAAIGTITLTSGIPGSTNLFVDGQKGDGTVAGSDAATVNFGATAFSMTPSSGYSYYA